MPEPTLPPALTPRQAEAFGALTEDDLTTLRGLIFGLASRMTAEEKSAALALYGRLESLLPAPPPPDAR